MIAASSPETHSYSDDAPEVDDHGPSLSRTTEDDNDGSANVPTVFCSSAALTVQKVYRGYRTRRRLADSAILAEELWWQVIDYARLNYNTISLFNFDKPETAVSRWHRVGANASKVGKGLSKDAKAHKLAFQHWIEAIDPRHRYGHNLHKYYEAWCKSDSGQPFFYWLDIGDGREVDLTECPRSKLRQQCIRYLGPQEREHYEYVLREGKIVHKRSGRLLDTRIGSQGAKCIFVMSTSHQIYAGEKKKGAFHHSSFLAGGATLAAGRLVVENGILKSISSYSGHYKPTYESLQNFLSFLKDNAVNLDEVQVLQTTEDSDAYEGSTRPRVERPHEDPGKSDQPIQDDIPSSSGSSPTAPTSTATTPSTSPSRSPTQATPKRFFTKFRSCKIAVSPPQLQPQPQPQTRPPAEVSSKQLSLSGGITSPRIEVPKQGIRQRMDSKNVTRSYQLGHQLSRAWSSGAGPRIGCMADYPLEVRQQALEIVNLSSKQLNTSLCVLLCSQQLVYTKN